MIKKPSIKGLRNKCDRVLQDTVRLVYDKCEVCGGELSCGHHFIPKSVSSYLRYYWPNIVPICVKCHVAIELRKSHDLTAIIVLKRGQEWLDDLRAKKSIYVKTDRFYYEQKYKDLTLALNGVYLRPYLV